MSDLLAPPRLTPEVALPNVFVQVTVCHLASHSQPGQQVFAYIVRLENRSDESWQVLGRDWRILDGDGQLTRVQGQGVVGQQPVLAPGAAFIYDSWVALQPPGQMSGRYDLRDAWGRPGAAHVAPFALPVPQQRLLN